MGKTSLFVFAAVTTVLALGCSTLARSARDAKTPEALGRAAAPVFSDNQPLATPTSALGSKGDLPCALIQGNFDPFPQTVDFLSSRSVAVLTGRFAGYGESYWNTPDHSPPDLATLRLGYAEIRTPILLDGIDALRGDSMSAAHAVLWNQGKVGCVEMTLDASPDLETGQSYAFFLRDSNSSLRQTDADLSVLAAFPVDSKGMIATAENGELSIAQLDMALDATLPVGPQKPQETSSEPDPDSGYP